LQGIEALFRCHLFLIFQVMNGVLALLTDTSLGIDAGYYDVAAVTAIDHVMAYGASEAVFNALPLLTNGVTLPKTVCGVYYYYSLE